MTYLFTFINTHNAITASHLFETEKLPVRVMPLPGQLGDACGICLRVDADYLQQAFDLIKDHGIATAGIYKIIGSGAKQVYEKWQ
ncbi:MAG: DUF3343 domain-containing protein [Lactobacillus sp.]|jgi:hypothetical protein|nr:DUF3343 domain-containing protein [Lactobacillus sp.]